MTAKDLERTSRRRWRQPFRGCHEELSERGAADACEAAGDRREFRRRAPAPAALSAASVPPALAPVDWPRSARRCRPSTAWPGWAARPAAHRRNRRPRRRIRGVSAVDGCTGQTALQRGARARDERSAPLGRTAATDAAPVNPPVSHRRPLQTPRAPGRPAATPPTAFGGMVEFVHKRFDHRCCVIDFGLQQFPGALAQPDQPVIGQHHMGHHRQTRHR